MKHEPDIDPSFFAEMVETVGVGVGIYGADGRYIYVNDAYADMFGVAPETIIGTHLWEIAPEMEAERFDRYWDSFDTGETRTAETEHTFGGTTVPVETNTTCRVIDGTPYHFGTIKDITERKERERELKRQNERLDAFAGVVSHDLRNPLNVAQGYLDILQDDIDREELHLVESSLKRMDILTDDLLCLARSGDAIDDTEPVSVTEIAEAAWKTVDTGDASLECETNGRLIQADGSRLQQLFENLFRNAIEHGGPTVTVTVGASDGGFYVADDGDGIPPEMRDDVFDAGYSTRSDGTGFGLSIVEQVAQAHDWEVRVSESADGGARFDITGVSFAS
ncbi:MAG: sensor histidine kinase [Haloplanus sp.]